MLRRCSRALSCAVLVAALMGACSTTASAEDAACALGDQPVSKLTEFGTQFVTLCLVNAERGSSGGSCRSSSTPGSRWPGTPTPRR